MSYPLQNNKIPSVMAFFPNVRGVGYSFFQSNKEHTISGMITTRDRFNNQRYMERIKQYMDRYAPKVVVLEEYRKTHGSVKTQRIAKLIHAIAIYAKSQGIKVICYKRSDVRALFSIFNVMTKYAIAKLICYWIPWLERYMYKPREGGRMEPYSSAVFEAASLGICYLYRN